MARSATRHVQVDQQSGIGSDANRINTSTRLDDDIVQRVDWAARTWRFPGDRVSF